LLRYDDFAEYGSYDSGTEIPSYESEYGILIEFKKKHSFNINTGITIDNQGFTTNPTDFTYHGQSYMYPGYYSRTEKKVINSLFHFVSVPFILNYEFPHKEDNYIYLGVGLDGKLLVNYSITGVQTSFSRGTEKRINALAGSIFGTANIGANISIDDKLALFIEPDLKYPINETAIRQSNYNTIRVRLWSYGCRVGIKF
jgi:hypothetical protein